MKARAALRKSLLSVQVLCVFIIVSGVVHLYLRSWITLMAVALSVAYLVMEVINVVYIRHRAARDPEYLDRRVS